MSRLIHQNYLILTIFAVFAYLWGNVSFQHYMPASSGFFISLYSAAILSVGLAFYLMRAKFFDISLTAIFWFVCVGLFLLQPVFHTVYYVDDLILSALTILLCAIFGWSVSTFDDNQKKQAINLVAVGMILTAVLVVMTQFAQLMRWDRLVGVLIAQAHIGRLSGNVAQPNQTAFVHSLALASLIYLICEYHTVAFFQRYRWLVYGFANILAVIFAFGLALTSSRGGLLLFACVFVGSALMYKLSLKKRVLSLFGFIPASWVGYTIGTHLIQQYNNSTMSAAGRLIGETESLGLRVSLLQQAQLAFESAPITGIGWGGLKFFGLQNAEKLSWFTVANNAHNIVAQIGAELGILGLLVFLAFCIVIIKNLRFNLPFHLAFSYIILGLIFAYSLSEYPLWFFKFLLITVFFIAIVDKSKISLKNNVSKPLFLASVLHVFGSVYYIQQYYHYVNASYAIDSDDTDYEADVWMYQNLPDVFGYTKYKELILYMLNPISEKNLSQQILLGDRVLSDSLDEFLMMKQAKLLMLAGKQEASDKLFRAACIFEYYKSGRIHCKNVATELNELTSGHKDYRGYYDRLKVWYEIRYQKPLLP